MKKHLLTSCLLVLAVAALQAQRQKGSKVEITNETTVNTDQLEFSPTFYEDGIVFISSKPVGDKTLIDRRIEKNAMSIFIARRGLDGVLKAPEPFSMDLTSPLHEGPVTFDKTAETVFFTRNNYIKGKQIKAKDGITKLKIFSSEKTNGKWDAVTDLPINNNEYDVCHPTISVDGDKLYFASNRPGGFGGMDIYVSTKIGNTWGEPVNLGPTINTEKNEVFPFIHADGTLFFASNGHNTKGGLDIFYAKPKPDGGFANPVNIGEPLNTANDDFGLIVDLDKKNGYFSSNRPGGKGEDDIYSFHTDGKLTEEEEVANEDETTVFIADKVNGSELDGAKISVIPLDDAASGDVITDADGNVISLKDGVIQRIESQSDVTDKEGKTKIKLKKGKNYIVTIEKPGYQTKQIVIKKGENRNEFMAHLEKAEDCMVMNVQVLGTKNNPIPGASVVIVDDKTKKSQMFTTDLNGRFNYCVRCGTSYTLTSTKDNYLSATKNVSTVEYNCRDKKTISAVLTMAQLTSPLVEGGEYQLKNIYYNFNDATLRPEGRNDLDALITVLKQFPEVSIEIGSHTDSRGTDAYNLDLSQKRADNVVAYLKSNGVDPSRIKATGYGESQLRNKCKNGVACSELEHQINRRTNFKIEKSDEEVMDLANVEFLSEKYVMGMDKGAKGSTKGAVKGSAAYTLNNSLENLTGSFAVIAGSFEEENNAKSQLETVKKAGFGEATIVKPDNFPFNRVLISKVSNLREARNLMRQLRTKGFPSFVLRT